MVAFIVLDLVFLLLAEQLVGKSISKMTYFVLSGSLNFCSVNKCRNAVDGILLMVILCIGGKLFLWACAAKRR